MCRIAEKSGMLSEIGGRNVLIEFRVENHRSLRDEQVLTMEAGTARDKADNRPRQVLGYSKDLLPVAALYGANASGKSNVLAALAFMRDAVFESHRLWSPDDPIPREPFAWGPKTKDPSLYEATFIQHDTRYQYGFSAADHCFLEEWLFAWPNGKKQMWFEREEQKFKFGENLKGENKLIEEVTRPNALFLSAAVQLKHEQLRNVYQWFRVSEPLNTRHIRNRGRRFLHRASHRFMLAKLLEEEISKQRQLYPEDEESDTILDDIRGLLRHADIGILDIESSKSELDDDRRLVGPRIRVKHQSTFEDAWLPLEEESQGTQTLFRIALPILNSIRKGSLLIVDELEDDLHPSLAQQIIRQYNDPASNPNNAQLVFATHDTNLLGTTLGKPVLRRDQVWLTEKDVEGASVLYPLSDFRPRKHENLERGYLQGRYGAIPYLGNFSVAGD